MSDDKSIKLSELIDKLDRKYRWHCANERYEAATAIAALQQELAELTQVKRFEVDIAVALSEEGEYVAFGSNCVSGQTSKTLFNDMLKGKCDDIVYIKAELDYTVDVGTKVVKIEEAP